jgi:hypothetical protein
MRNFAVRKKMNIIFVAYVEIVSYFKSRNSDKSKPGTANSPNEQELLDYNNRDQKLPAIVWCITPAMKLITDNC